MTIYYTEHTVQYNKMDTTDVRWITHCYQTHPWEI